MKTLIRLFKAVEIKDKKKKNSTKSLLKRTLNSGFIFSPYVVSNFSEDELFNLSDIVERELGLSSEKMNSSFHKSWEKIKTADLDQLIREQLIHYFTTYGFEKLGIYDKDSVYIPKEKLDIPELNEDFKIIIINGYTKEEIKEKVFSMLESGVAYEEKTVKDLFTISSAFDIEKEELESIKNKEIKMFFYSCLKVVPENQIEFLRYVIFKITGRTLLIKDYKTINEIKKADEIKKATILFLLNEYKSKYGLERLSELFYRFKPIFLAMRVNKKTKQLINKIKRLAEIHHKPMQEDYLNEITSKINKEIKIDDEKITFELKKVNIFRKIRLAYALKFRTEENKSILYKIRNGKGYATEFSSYSTNKRKEAKRILNIILKSISDDIRPNIEGKRIFIPKNINYTLPATEKQFIGNLPSGSYSKASEDIIIGVHWENTNNHRIDLDLSLMSIDAKYGWDRLHRSDDGDILFSGDMTDAPKPDGASELFYVKRQKNSAYLLCVNFFNYDEGNDEEEILFDIFVAQEKIKNIKENYMINPNNIICREKTSIKEKQKILGLLVINKEESKFYFTQSEVGKTITSANNEFMENTRKFIHDFYTNSIELSDVLEKAGAILVKNKDKCDLDLSQETLEKDTILNLFYKK